MFEMSSAEVEAVAAQNNELCSLVMGVQPAANVCGHSAKLVLAFLHLKYTGISQFEVFRIVHGFLTL